LVITVGAARESKEKILNDPVRAIKSPRLVELIVTANANSLAKSFEHFDAFGRTILIDCFFDLRSN
jgi:hypothetical protein